MARCTHLRFFRYCSTRRSRAASRLVSAAMVSATSPLQPEHSCSLTQPAERHHPFVWPGEQAACTRPRIHPLTHQDHARNTHVDCVFFCTVLLASGKKYGMCERLPGLLHSINASMHARHAHMGMSRESDRSPVLFSTWFSGMCLANLFTNKLQVGGLLGAATVQESLPWALCAATLGQRLTTTPMSTGRAPEHGAAHVHTHHRPAPVAAARECQLHRPGQRHARAPLATTRIMRACGDAVCRATPPVLRHAGLSASRRGEAQGR